MEDLKFLSVFSDSDIQFCIPAYPFITINRSYANTEWLELEGTLKITQLPPCPGQGCSVPGGVTGSMAKSWGRDCPTAGLWSCVAALTQWQPFPRYHLRLGWFMLNLYSFSLSHACLPTGAIPRWKEEAFFSWSCYKLWEFMRKRCSSCPGLLMSWY